MEGKIVVTIVALIVLCILELAAMEHGINGQLFFGVLVIIAGAIGVPLGLRANERLKP